MRERTPAIIVADIVAVIHLVVAQLIFVIGETTTVFRWVALDYGGIKFVYQYIDKPVFELAKLIGFADVYTPTQQYLVAQFVILGSTLLYGFGAYVLVTIISQLLNESD